MSIEHRSKTGEPIEDDIGEVIAVMEPELAKCFELYSENLDYSFSYSENESFDRKDMENCLSEDTEAVLVDATSPDFRLEDAYEVIESSKYDPEVLVVQDRRDIRSFSDAVERNSDMFENVRDRLELHLEMEKAYSNAVRNEEYRNEGFSQRIEEIGWDTAFKAI